MRNGFVKSGRVINLNTGLLVHIKAIPLNEPFLSQIASYIQLQENLQSEKHAMSSLLTQNGQFIISQRPFIFTSIKSRFIHIYDEDEMQVDWIVFQLLRGLSELHEHGIWHGDIKPENIMLTETNWIVYVDFASWKPKEIDSISYESYFNTNRSFSCYTAPERWKKKTSINLFKADIFSLGCVLYEFLNHASHAFYSVDEMLNAKLPNMECIPEKYKDLLVKMLDPNPYNRPSLQNILTGDDSYLITFPRLFHSYMTSYLALLPINSPRSPQRKDPFDSTILRLFKDSDDLVNIFDDPNILLILLQIITLCMQRCRKEEPRLIAFKILNKFPITNSFIWPRILPEILCLISDRSSPLIRVCVVEFTGRILHLINEIPFLKDIILPLFKNLMANDMSDLVRLNVSRFLSNFHNEEFTQLILMEESNVDIRVAFINDLKASIPSSSEISIIVTQLNESNHEVRIASLKFLYKHISILQKSIILPILIHSFHRRNHIDVYMIILDMILEIIQTITNLKTKRILDLIEKISCCIYHPIMSLKAKEIMNFLKKAYPEYSYLDEMNKPDDELLPLSTGLYEIILHQGLSASQFIQSFIKEQSDLENVYTDSYKLQQLSKMLILEAEWLGKYLEQSHRQDLKYSRKKWPIKSLRSIDSIASFTSNSNNNSTSNTSLEKLKINDEEEYWRPYGRILTSIKIPINATCLGSSSKFWITGHDHGLINLWSLDFKISSDRMKPILSYKIPVEQEIIELSCQESCENGTDSINNFNNDIHNNFHHDHEEDWYRIIILTQKYHIYIIRIFLDSMIRHLEVETCLSSPFPSKPVYYKWSQRGIFVVLSNEIRMYSHHNSNNNDLISNGIDGNNDHDSNLGNNPLIWKLKINETIYCAHTPDNTILAMGLECGKILVYDLRFAILVSESKVSNGCIYDLRARLTRKRDLSSEGKYSLHIYYQISNNIHVWNVESNEIIFSMKNENHLLDIGKIHSSTNENNITGMNGMNINEGSQSQNQSQNHLSNNVMNNGFSPIIPYRFMTVLMRGDIILAKSNGQLKYWNPEKDLVQESPSFDILSGSSCLGMIVLNRQELILILLSSQRLLVLR